MNNWIKKNKDALIITGVSIAATALVVGVTYRISSNVMLADSKLLIGQMNSTAYEAGVLDQIIAHQEKLKTLIK